MSQDKILDSLVKKTGNKNNWRARIEALEELQEHICPRANDVIIRLALHDKVFSVKNKAFLLAQSRKLKKSGKDIRLTRKNIGYKNKDFIKLFSRIRREKKMSTFDLQVFKDTFLTLNPEMFDVMNYEKKNGFDTWIVNTYNSLPKTIV